MHARVRLKICGMTKEEDLAHAASLGVDAIGLIFTPQSPRYISINQAKKLLLKRPPFVDAVAVLVNPTIEWVNEIINELPIDYLQFHGEESREFCNQFAKPYIKALQVNSTEAIYQAAEIYQDTSAILLDTPSTTRHGGTGEVFDWDLIPKNLAKPIILAGGLKIANIKMAVAKCSPYAVDLCSGVESKPGSKDHQKMREFVETLWDIK